MDALETKLGRPALLGSRGEPKPETKAFNNFLRTGDDTEIKTLSAGSSPDGGFAIPEEISTKIEALLLKQSVMRQICNAERSSTLNYRKVINKRGTAAAWVGETGARTSSATPQLANITFP